MSHIVDYQTERLRLVAGVNGRARVDLHVFELPELVTPQVSLSVNPAAPKDRAEVVAALAESLRDEAADGLKALAARVTAARAAFAPPPGSTPTPEPDLQPADEPVDGAALLEAIVGKLRRYVVLGEAETVAITLWVLHAGVADVADYSPYLLVSSPTRQCGKSTLLDLLAQLVPRAERSDGFTAAALYRTIDRVGPTVAILLDELDTRLRGDGGEALRGVLNSGFQASGKQTICAGDDNEPRAFKTYGPKVLSGIGRAWDTVTSRSIPIKMHRATPDEIKTVKKVRGHRIGQECLPIRRQVLRWGQDHRDELREADPTVPEELNARQADVWRPLFAIADVADGGWPEAARTAAKVLHGAAEDEGDWGLLLLEDAHRIVTDRQAADRQLVGIHTEDLLEALLEMGESRPWQEYGRDRRPITKRGIATLLGRFDIKTKSIRQGDRVRRGYALTDLVPAFERYLSDGNSPPEPSATSATTESVADVADSPGGPTYEEIERQAIQEEAA